ncbi:MAG: TerB family tellurite resistance protein [Myxococcales bacterium]|nr:TerB family tellurite resistance protein [Myxococcales bacterium]
MMQTLDREDRLRLMKFICSFAWADLEVQDAERKFVHRLVAELELDDAEKAKVEDWLEVPPPAEEVDPADIPKAHRQLFLDTVRAIIVADGKVDADEAESFALLEALLR